MNVFLFYTKGKSKPKIYRFTITSNYIATFKFSDYFSSYEEFLNKTQFLVCGNSGVTYGQYCANNNGKTHEYYAKISHTNDKIAITSTRGSDYPINRINFILVTDDIDIMNYGYTAKS